MTSEDNAREHGMQIDSSGHDPTSARVLVVDDEASIRTVVRSMLHAAGYEVDVAEDAGQARHMLGKTAYDILLSDVILPGVSGVDLIKMARQAAPDIQMIMMTGEPTLETATAAVRAGVCDYLPKPVSRETLLRAVAGAAKVKQLNDERSRLTEEKAAYQRTLEQLVQERTRKLEEALHHWKTATEGTILAMASAIESRDPYTAGHQLRVAALGRAIARELGLADDLTDAVYYAGLVHDLGKISVPAEILTNPGKLCKEAMSLIRKHSRSGYRILEKVSFPWPIAQIVLEHHERLDGTGYPQGLAGEAIRLEARILAVADVVEAMASHRPYRPALGIDAALTEIERGCGMLYDASVVTACLRLFREKHFTFDGAMPASTVSTD